MRRCLSAPRGRQRVHGLPRRRGLLRCHIVARLRQLCCLQTQVAQHHLTLRYILFLVGGENFEPFWERTRFPPTCAAAAGVGAGQMYAARFGQTTQAAHRLRGSGDSHSKCCDSNRGSNNFGASRTPRIVAYFFPSAFRILAATFFPIADWRSACRRPGGVSCEWMSNKARGATTTTSTRNETAPPSLLPPCLAALAHGSILSSPELAAKVVIHSAEQPASPFPWSMPDQIGPAERTVRGAAPASAPASPAPAYPSQPAGGQQSQFAGAAAAREGVLVFGSITHSRAAWFSSAAASVLDTGG